MEHPLPVATDWEEVVEVSFAAWPGEYALTAFDVGAELALPGPGSYRARWHASGMDHARRADVRMNDEPALDRYLLQLWPASPTADTIVRQTSEAAGYWHGVARETPPPPSPQEIAARLAAEEEDRRRQEEAWRVADEARQWGGRAPTPKLLAIGARARQVAAVDRDLADTLAALPGRHQRVVAVWAARRSCELADIADLDWVRAGLTAAERGEPLPAPWQSWESAWERLHPLPPGEKRRSGFSISFAAPDAPPARIDSGSLAISAVIATGEPDAAVAVMTAVEAFGHMAFARRARLAEVAARVAAGA